MVLTKNRCLHLSDLGAALTPETLLNAPKARQNAAAFLANLSPAVAKRVEVLMEIQSEHDELEAKFFEERRALENKYQKLYQPLYTKRYDIVNGVVEVDGVSNEPAEQGEDKLAQEKGVPDFWLTAMKSNEVLAESIQEQDEEALKYVKDIKWYRNVPKDDNKKGDATERFKLEFFFDPNPYFKNSVLTKTYYMVDEDEPLPEKAIGTEIEWLPGKCLTEKILKKPKKRSKNAKPITITVDSFFNFFSSPEEAAEELQSQDYDIGSAIREKIIPHAVSWFTREAAVDDDDDDDDDEENEDDDKTNSHKKVSNAHSGASQEFDARYSVKRKAFKLRYVDVDETALALGFFLDTRRELYKDKDDTNFELTPDAYQTAMRDFNFHSKDELVAGAKERYSVEDNNVPVSTSMKKSKPRKLAMSTRARKLDNTLIHMGRAIYSGAFVKVHRKKYPDTKVTRKHLCEAYATFRSFNDELKAPYVAEALRIYLVRAQDSKKLTDRECSYFVPEED